MRKMYYEIKMQVIVHVDEDLMPEEVEDSIEINVDVDHDNATLAGWKMLEFELKDSK